MCVTIFSLLLYVFFNEQAVSSTGTVPVPVPVPVPFFYQYQQQVQVQPGLVLVPAGMVWYGTRYLLVLWYGTSTCCCWYHTGGSSTTAGGTTNHCADKNIVWNSTHTMLCSGIFLK